MQYDGRAGDGVTAVRHGITLVAERLKQTFWRTSSAAEYCNPGSYAKPTGGCSPYESTIAAVLGTLRLTRLDLLCVRLPFSFFFHRLVVLCIV